MSFFLGGGGVFFFFFETFQKRSHFSTFFAFFPVRLLSKTQTQDRPLHQRLHRPPAPRYGLPLAKEAPARGGAGGPGALSALPARARARLCRRAGRWPAGLRPPVRRGLERRVGRSLGPVAGGRRDDPGADRGRDLGAQDRERVRKRWVSSFLSVEKRSRQFDFFFRGRKKNSLFFFH